MNLYKISDKIVFNTLNNIKYGYLEIISHSGELLKFGNPNDQYWSFGLPNFNNSPLWLMISKYPYLMLFKVLKTILSEILYKFINFQK